MHHTPDNIKASFSNLLAKKGRYEANDILLLETLLLKYPYSQPLHLLYAAVVQENKPRFEKYLPKAAGITAHREVLFNIIHKPQNFWLDADIETIRDNGVADEDFLVWVELVAVLDRVDEGFFES